MDIPVVFMANDRFVHWALPFLRSLRAHAPAVRLYCVPFDDDLARLRAAAQVFNFTFLDADYSAIDRLAAMLFPKHPYQRRRLRKLAAFGLPRFLYLDCDLLVANPLAPPVRAAASRGSGLVYFELSPDWVYAHAASVEAVLRFGAVPRFSTGALLSLGCGLDCRGWLRALADAAPLWRRLRAPWVVDQPAINLIAHLRGIPLAALEDVAPGWTGRGHANDGDLAWTVPAGLTLHGRAVAVVHWAGRTKVDVPPVLAPLVARFGAPLGAAAGVL